MTTGLIRLSILPISGLASLMSAAVILRDVGKSDFGVIMMVTAIPLLIPFADLGSAAAIVNRYASGDLARARELTISAWRLLWLVVLGLLTAIALCGMMGAWDEFLGIDTGKYRAWVWILFSVLLCGAIPLGIGQRILVGLNRVPLATTLQLAFPVTNIVIVIIGRLCDLPSLYIVAGVGAQFVTTLASFCVGVRLARVTASQLFEVELPARSDVRELAHTAAPMFVVMIGLPVTFQSHRLMLAHWSDRTALGDYSIMMALYAPAWAIVSSAGLNLWPHFAMSRDKVAFGESLNGLKKGLLGAVIFGLVYSLGFIVAAPFVTTLWAGSAIPMTIWLAAGGLLLIQTVQLPIGMFMTSPQMLRTQAACISVLAVAVVIGTRPLVQHFGAAAPLLASAAGVLVCQIVPELCVLGVRKRSEKSIRRSPSLV